MTTKEHIITSTITIMARDGYAATSMRKVAASVNREPSIIYTHFSDKEALLRAARFHIIKLLDEKQQAISITKSKQMMQTLVRFQLENRLLIVALLQYFMAMRQDFPQEDGGYVPPRAYEHMSLVLREGIRRGIYHSNDVNFDAKAMIHMVGGFLMEYFDKELSRSELTALSKQLAQRLEKMVAVSQVST